MASISINAPGASGFIYNNANLGTSRVCVTAETPEFDNQTLRAWSDEGFDVVYVPFNNGGKDYAARLRTVKDGLGVGDNYAIIAFGDAASYCLDYFLKPTNASRLAALVAYYPTTIPDTRNHYPQSLRVLCHLAGNTVDMITIPTALGLQGKKKRTTKKINPGIGTGERLNIGWPTFTYASVEPGFAESDLEEYDRLASDLAWSRTLQVLRKAFGKDLDLEWRWEEHLEARFFSMNLKGTVEPYVSHLNPAVTIAPTMSGAIGTHALRRFYEHHFLRKLPPSMRLRLISRTVGADRVVDELYASFEHTEEIPWMLPGIPPTNKRVEVILVSIVSLRAGRLYSEHMYWDQASVLVQLGLLDPKYVPSGVAPGVDRLPVVGREAARRIVEEDPESEKKDYHNRLIRRARAKQRGKNGLVEESGTEAGDVEKPLADGQSKGKNVQRNGKEQNGHNNGEHDGAVGDEHHEEEPNGHEQEEEEQNGRETPTSNGTSKKPAAATVEDEPKSDD
ncbi:dienelactone hydrolase [Aspergillus saccharolyticus JOP 1030-1]|uniref:Dienelactone hydrolase n=1 Tax=Aspergillus saccharolyticus JOP 1030-1 TaxID=1450539 RepID=A0A318ZK55_9EURO|nr:dienelactone hydrolase [Aspergillus saccharolyticus JOP 1030-1]PYH47175.1 dienelactone hydrolase [Aspergillus saccharolyticus JOP 1030-1]